MMTTLEAILVFAGLPTAIFGTIAALTFATGSRRVPRPPDPPPLGTRIQEVSCVVRETDGRAVHEPSREEGPRCWTVRCAECGTPYTEGTEDVHFTGPSHGVSTVSARGCRLAGARLRCPRCA